MSTIGSMTVALRGETGHFETSMERSARSTEKLEAAVTKFSRNADAVFKATRTPLEQLVASFNSSIGNVNELFKKGAIDADTYKRAIGQLGGEFSKIRQLARETGKEVAGYNQAVANAARIPGATMGRVGGGFNEARATHDTGFWQSRGAYGPVDTRTAPAGYRGVDAKMVGKGMAMGGAGEIGGLVGSIASLTAVAGPAGLALAGFAAAVGVVKHSLDDATVRRGWGGWDALTGMDLSGRRANEKELLKESEKARKQVAASANQMWDQAVADLRYAGDPRADINRPADEYIERRRQEGHHDERFLARERAEFVAMKRSAIGQENARESGPAFMTEAIQTANKSIDFWSNKAKEDAGDWPAFFSAIGKSASEAADEIKDKLRPQLEAISKGENLRKSLRTKKEITGELFGELAGLNSFGAVSATTMRRALADSMGLELDPAKKKPIGLSSNLGSSAAAGSVQAISQLNQAVAAAQAAKSQADIERAAREKLQASTDQMVNLLEQIKQTQVTVANIL